MVHLRVAITAMNAGEFGSLATRDDVRVSDPRAAFPDREPSGQRDILSSYFYQLLYSYRPNQIYQGPFFFLLFRTTQ